MEASGSSSYQTAIQETTVSDEDPEPDIVGAQLVMLPERAVQDAIAAMNPPTQALLQSLRFISGRHWVRRLQGEEMNDEKFVFNNIN